MTRFSGQVCLAIFSSLAVIAAAQASNGKVTYTIKVVDINGGPVVGAEVAALEVSYDYADGRKHMELIEQKKTGADGTTVLSLDFSRHKGAFIVARKESLAFTWDRLDDNALPIDGSQLTMLLDRPCVLAGTVVDQLGKPVAGARVRGEFDSSCLHNKHRINTPEDWFTVETDDQGRFRFDNVPPDGTADFLVTAPGKANVYTFMASDSMPGYRYAAGRTDISIVLPPEAKVQGRVLDPAGNPATGVRLLLRPDKTNANYYCTNRAVSGQDGRFLFENVPADAYSLQVIAPRDTMAQWVARDVKVIAKEGQITDGVIVRVSEGGLLEVAVQDAATNRPADDVYVCVWQKAGFNRYHPCFWHDIRTDRNGRARFRVPLGQCQVTAGSGEYSNFEDKVVIRHRPSQIRVLLYHNPEISGTVRDQFGRAVPGAAVAVVPPGHPAVRTDANGKFYISWQVVSKQAFLFARDQRSNLAAAVEIKDLTRPMNIVLEPALTLAGRITDPNGLPIPVARIQLCARPIPGWVAYIGGEALTDTEGRYEIPAVLPQQKDDVYLVHVNAAGYRGLRGERVSLTETSANRVDLSLLIMQPLNMSVSGVVVDADGKPIPNKSVHLRGPPGGQGQPGKHTITDADGRFFFDRICKGPLQFQAGWARDKDEVTVDAQAGDKDVKIVMGRKGP
ncbi:MAG: carboxypeptidase-like regulatory domain-containing protein [Planctomycetota bacterium]